MTTRLERYLAHLATLSGGVEWRIHEVETNTTPEVGDKVLAIAFPGVPEGVTTSFTYGLSDADYPEWTRGKPELVVSTNGDDLSWGIALSMLVERLRGSGPFSYGDVIDTGTPIVEGSKLTAFFINRPLVVSSQDALNIDLGDRLPVHIAGAIPLHPSEAEAVRKGGAAVLNGIDFDPFDVTRKPAL